MQAVLTNPTGDFEPMRRALHGHMTDREYGALMETEARSLRAALEQIREYLRQPCADRRTISEIVTGALDPFTTS